MFLQFPLAHTEVIQNASLAPQTAKEENEVMAWEHGMGPSIAHVVSSFQHAFWLGGFSGSFCFFIFSTSSLYLRAESVIFETWRLARILFPHHIGAIFDKHLKSNVSIDSNLWNATCGM